MKVHTLVRLLVKFVTDKGWWQDFMDEIERDGFDPNDVNILIDK